MRALVVLLLVTPALVGCLGAGDDALDPATTAPPTSSRSGFSDTHVFPGSYDTSGPFARTLELGPYEPLAPIEERLASRVDGADIRLQVQRPDASPGERVPVVAMASPYLMGFDWESATFVRLAGELVPHGYAVAYIAVRGTGDSGGCNEVFGPNERSDLDQAVTWLAERSWSNGNVGMIGRSYEAVAAWEVAATGNPYLKTIVPISGATDPFELFWGNGTWNVGSASLGHNAGYYPHNYGIHGTGPAAYDRAPERMLAGAVCPAVAEGLAASGAATVTGEPDPLGFWTQRNQRPGVLEHYQGSIFLVHGLQDWNAVAANTYPFVNELEGNGIVVKHLLGQWGHAWPDQDTTRNPSPRWDWAELMLHWFDRWLKEDPSVDLGPRVQVQDTDMRWRSGIAWPPQDAEPRIFYLGPDGRLSEDPRSGRASIPATTNVVAPNPGNLVANDTVQYWTHPLVSFCPACPTFSTEPLEHDLRFAGLPRVPITVTPHGPGGQLTAYLYSVDDAGKVERLGWGAIDLRFADGTREANPVEPGEQLLVKLQLDSLDVVAKDGERLVLQLHQGGEGAHNWPARTPYPLDIEVGGEQSRLILDVFERSGEAFFTPPGVDVG